MNPEESIKLAEKYEIPVPKYAITKDVSEAKKIAEKIGYPVVLKTLSQKISHKSDANGVSVGICEKDMEKEFKRILKIGGNVLIQQQVNGIETIIGGIVDSQFGPCISFGTGGIFVEAIKDVNFRACPISKKDAKDMVKESKIYRILKGYRGKKYDISGIVDVLVKISKMVIREGVKELDINPLICSEKDVWAVDIRVN